MSYETNDPYTYSNSLVLKNKLDIRDAKILSQVETEIYDVMVRKEPPTGEFDYKHLQALHKHLFSEVYEWAGETRVVNLAKKTDYAGSTMFAMFDRIEPEINKTLARLNVVAVDKNNPNAFARYVSEYFNEINAAHPFREGNGRTNRLFCAELAKKHGYEIDWDAMSKDAYINASIQGALNADYQPMTELISQNMIVSNLHKDIALTQENIMREIEQKHHYLEENWRSHIKDYRFGVTDFNGRKHKHPSTYLSSIAEDKNINHLIDHDSDMGQKIEKHMEAERELQHDLALDNEIEL